MHRGKCCGAFVHGFSALQTMFFTSSSNVVSTVPPHPATCRNNERFQHVETVMGSSCEYFCVVD